MTLILIAAAGLAAGILLTTVALVVVAPRLMVVESPTSLGFEEAVQAITEAAAARGWKVPTVHRIDQTLAAAGYTVEPAAVVELCRPDYAEQILRSDSDRVVTSFMPCRISVYRTSDGRVVISRMRSGLVARLFGGTVARVMAAAAADSELILAAAGSPLRTASEAPAG